MWTEEKLNKKRGEVLYKIIGQLINIRSFWEGEKIYFWDHYIEHLWPYNGIDFYKLDFEVVEGKYKSYVFTLNEKRRRVFIKGVKEFKKKWQKEALKLEWVYAKNMKWEEFVFWKRIENNEYVRTDFFDILAVLKVKGMISKIKMISFRLRYEKLFFHRWN